MQKIIEEENEVVSESITKPFENVQGLEAIILGLDKAIIKPVYTENVDNRQHQKMERYAAIINENRKIVEAIVSNKYTLVQHKDAFEPLIKAVKLLNIKVHGEVVDCGGRVYINMLFDSPEAKVIPADGHEIQLGLRAINSYDASHALFAEAYGYRALCTNGMILGKTLVSCVKKIHIGEISEAKLMSTFIKEVLKSSPKLIKLTNDAIKERVSQMHMQVVFKRLKFGDRQVMKILKRVKKHEEITRYDLYNRATDWITHQPNITEDTKRVYHSRATELLEKPIAIIIGRE